MEGISRKKVTGLKQERCDGWLWALLREYSFNDSRCVMTLVAFCPGEESQWRVVNVAIEALIREFD